MELESLLNRFDSDLRTIFGNLPNDAPERQATVDHGANASGVATVVDVFNCPSDTKEPFAHASWRPQNREATSSYAFCMGSLGPSLGISPAVKVFNNGMFIYFVGIQRRTIEDGTSNTFLIGEVFDGHLRESSNRWTAAGRHVDCMRSTDNPLGTPPGTGITVNLYGYRTNGAFGSRHEGGAQFGFVDGHVDFISENIELEIYQALSTRNGGEVSTR